MTRIVEQLEKENKELHKELSELRLKVAFFENNQELTEAIKLETIVAEAVSGNTTALTEGHDVEIVPLRMRLEVKFARLNQAVQGAATKRWCWAKPFGYGENKIYDTLILIGERDSRYREYYKEKDQPYVIFDVPYEEVLPLCTKAGAQKNIYLSTNPNTSRSATAVLYQKYQVSIAELRTKYRMLIEQGA